MWFGSDSAPAPGRRNIKVLQRGKSAALLRPAAHTARDCDSARPNLVEHVLSRAYAESCTCVLLSERELSRAEPRQQLPIARAEPRQH
jgi:hypothetical protein